MAPRNGQLHLSDRDSSQSTDGYDAAAPHELGHWPGHPRRLDRDYL